MHRPVLLQALICSSFLLGLALRLNSQTQDNQETESSEQEFSSARLASQPELENIQILYTGRLLGYFRVPDWQGPAADGTGCEKMADRSVPAREFDELLARHPIDGAILLGAGDNFAPEIEAREFCTPPPALPKMADHYAPVGKEFFSWEPGTGWIPNDSMTLKSASGIRQTLQHGTATIPFDNVANFLVQEGYAAVLPGKHDFYFGPERLRELARYLASTPIPASRTFHGKSVEMLGANLVIETKWKNDHSRLTDKEEPPWFIPRFPRVRDLMGLDDAQLAAAGLTDSELKLTGLSDHGSVYPWFQGPTVQVSNPDAANILATAFQNANIYLCQSLSAGRPNQLPNPSLVSSPHYGACPKVNVSMERSAGLLQFKLQFPTTDPRLTTGVPGNNYGLCVDVAKGAAKDQDGTHMFCVRFSVYTPFFQFPWSPPQCQDKSSAEKPCYQDPDPFVFLERTDAAGTTIDMAIFGVVDSHLTDYIGLLNLGWENTDPHYATQTRAADPAEALRQLDGYFRQWYDHTYPNHSEGERSGKRRLIRVLLAQMSPQQAEILATRVKGFQVVVSAADDEMATVGDASMTEWNAPPPRTRDYPRFLAVPEPFYSKNRDPGQGPWFVDVGSLQLQLTQVPRAKWNIVSYHMQQASNIKPSHVEPVNFWRAVNTSLVRDCLPPEFAAPPGAPIQDAQNDERSSQIQLLTLCVMQRTAEADVALLQKRDIFAELPTPTGDVANLASPDKLLQQIVDRIIWKGDLLDRLYIPGSALKKALDQSKIFDADDKSNISLSDEKLRGLAALGVTFDSDHNEYTINGTPLDPNKLYSVVTSDYLSAGDTGYPDLASAQAKPPLIPKDFDQYLTTISSLVCRELAGTQADADCLDRIDRDDYFDEITRSPDDFGPSKTPGKQLEIWSLFHDPGPVPGEKPAVPEASQDGVQRSVEQRSLWDFNLVKWTLGITTLGHNGTDYDVQNNFGGITTPGVNALRATTWTSDLQAQWTLNRQHNQIFAIPAYTYNVQYKGQPDDLRQVNQIADLGMFDLGIAHLWNGRGAEHYDSVLSTHFETPLTRAFLVFPLGSSHAGIHGESIKDQIRFHLDRSYTEFLRAGFRWKRRVSSVEFGPEWGHEWNALQGIDFVTNSLMISCPATASVPISQCVKLALKANPSSIATTSQVVTQRVGQDHSGAYWKLNLTVPFHPRVSYVLSDSGDWFFVHFHPENSTTTLFRDYSQHQLKFTIFPSFSIGPEIDLLFYKNKSVGGLPGHFLRQDQLIMKGQFSFDWFNHRKPWRQIQYAPPTPVK